MLKWEMRTRRLVVHSNGHQIELKSGSWSEPFEIHPKIIKGTDAIESVRLIREGIAFAKSKSHSRPVPA